MTRSVNCRAAAKINLVLHVTGQRADGFHLLDSLVCFADIADGVSVAFAPRPPGGLRITGPMAAQVPTGDDNLVARAARLIAPGDTVQITLDKQLPVAAGIGGGSADAAACLLALKTLCQRPLPDPLALVALGADVPVCLNGHTLRMRGIGDRIDRVPALPEFEAVLVNPGVALSTRQVFAHLSVKENPPPGPMPTSTKPDEWVQFLIRQRNDLEAPAIALAPVIAMVLSAIRASPGCQLARMSGSGATCFGLFKDREAALIAAGDLARNHPHWWVKKVRLGG